MTLIADIPLGNTLKISLSSPPVSVVPPAALMIPAQAQYTADSVWIAGCGVNEIGNCCAGENTGSRVHREVIAGRQNNVRCGLHGDAGI